MTKSTYPSRYSPKKFVTPAQYIIELVCEKKAKKEKKDLPTQFWKLPEWANYFKMQLRKCHALLKKYDASSIIKALNDKRCWSTYSLHAAWLEPIINEYEDKKIIIEPDISAIFPIKTENITFERKSTSKNQLSRIEDIDAE